MAELKAVIQSLLQGKRPLDEVCEEADLVLARRGMYATAQIAEVDLRAKSSKEWRKLQAYLQENAKHRPGLQELMASHA